MVVGDTKTPNLWVFLFRFFGGVLNIAVATENEIIDLTWKLFGFWTKR